MCGLWMEMLNPYGGLNQREIGEMLGLDYNPVSVARKRYGVMANEDRKYLRLGERMESKLIQEKKDLPPIANCLESAQRVSE